MATGKFDIVDRGWNAIKRQLELADSKVIAVGVLDGSAPHPAGPTMGEIATWNHYGTETIPARPFITRPIDLKNAELRTLVQRLMRGISLGKITAGHAAEILGQKLRDTCVAAINAREFEPNAQSTIDRKGSSTPLVDTGQLKGAITYQVRDE